MALFALGAAVRALGFAGPRFFTTSGDHVRLAVQALGILQGTLPVHYLGHEYAGAGPAFPLAAWFALAGASPLALDVFCFGVGLAGLWTGYLLARRLLPPPSALLALGVLVVPPLMLAKWSLAGALDYPFLLLFGHVLLLLTHTLFFRGPGRARTILALGLASGAAVWTHLLSVVYVAPAIVLGVRTGLVFRRRALLFPTGTLLGLLPALVYELQHFPSTRFSIHGAGGIHHLTLGERASIVFGDFLPGLLGAQSIDIRPSLTTLAVVVVLGLGVIAVVQATLRDRGDLAWLVGLGGRRDGGSTLLWIVALAALALLTLTQRGVHGGQYVLPLYSVLPCWIGDTLRRLWRRRRALCVGALGAFVWVQGVATWTTIVRAEPEKLARWAPVQQRVAPLRAWLDARGIDRLYWAPPGSFEFSYLTGLRLVAAHPWAEIASPLSHLVDAAATPPILVDPKDAGSVADGLRAIGMEPRATPIGAFVVFRPEPVVPMGFAPLSPEGWTVTSSHQPDMTRFLVDRDATTGWGTDQPQAPGQWLAVDLGSIQEVARIDLLTFSSREAPAGFRVEASRDGASWVTVVSVPRYWHPVFFSERHPFFKLQRARVQAIFRPVHARFIRITQTGSSPRHEWAAREIFVYRPTPPPREVAGPEIVAALRREHVTFVHSNPWLSAVVRTESGWRIGSTEWNAVVNSYGRPGPPGGYTVFRAEAGHAILAGSDADLDGIREMLTSRWAPVRESDVGPYRLMVLPPPSARRRWMSSKGWGATASENDAESRLGIDGHTPTRWVSRSPMGPGLTFAVDLRTVRRVAAVELKPALADVGLEGSRDGAAWFPIEPVHWAGPILWTGWELLRAETHAWAVTFSPVDLRYLRVRPLRITGSPWAIQELRIFD